MSGLGLSIARTVRARRLSLAAGPIAPPAEPPVFVLIAAGQSNAGGRTPRTAEDTDVANVFQFDCWPASPTFRTIIADITPVLHPWPLLDNGSEHGDFVGPAEYAARQLREDRPDARIVIVGASRGSQAMTGPTATWNPGNPGGAVFETMIDNANRAMAAAAARWPQATIRPLMFFVQGEQDANNDTARATYRAALTQFVATVRARITGATDMPVVIGSMVPDKWVLDEPTYFASYAAINAAHVDVSLSVPGVHYARGPSDPSQLNDNIHYMPAAAVRAQGRAIGRAFGMQPGPVVTSPASATVTVGQPLSLPLTSAADHATFAVTGGADAARFAVSDPYLEPKLVFAGDAPVVGDYAVTVQARNGSGQWGPAQACAITVAAAAAYAPASAFTAGEPGGVWDLTVSANLFQDRAGTIPVTGPDQPVGMVRDASPNGNHLRAINDGVGRPMLRRDANARLYLDFAGEQGLTGAPFSPNDPRYSVVAGIAALAQADKPTIGVFGAAPSYNTMEVMRTGGADAVLTMWTASGGGYGPWQQPQVAGAFDGTIRVLSSQFAGPYQLIRMRDATGPWDEQNKVWWEVPLALTQTAVGHRPGTAAMFTGRIYSFAAIGRVLSDADIANWESWVAARAGVVL